MTARSRLRSREIGASSWRVRLRRLMRRPGEVTVEGVRYRPRTATPLRASLLRDGHKDYDVDFPTGERVRIRATRWRQYADLTGRHRESVYACARGMIRPGMRVLELNAGTGDGSAYLARLVGASGAVVSLETDRESVRFARRRHPLENVAHEIGGLEAVAGELDGAFEFVVAHRTLTNGSDALPALLEMIRLVAPGGGLMLIAPRRRRQDPAHHDAEPDEPRRLNEHAVRLLVAQAMPARGVDPDSLAPDPARVQSVVRLTGPTEDPIAVLIGTPAPLVTPGGALPNG